MTSGLRRTLGDRGARRARGSSGTPCPSYRELRGGRLEDLARGRGREQAFVGFFDGAMPESRRFLGGETVGELLDRVTPAFDAIVADETGTRCCSSCTAASTARSSRARSPASASSSAASSRRRAASTCSTSAPSAGSSGRSTSPRPTRFTGPDGRRRWSALGSVPQASAGDQRPEVDPLPVRPAGQLLLLDRDTGSFALVCTLIPGSRNGLSL